MIDQERTEQLEHIASAMRATITFRIECGRRSLGCKQSSEVTFEPGILAPQQAKETFYADGWRLKQIDGAAVIHCGNCDYTDTSDIEEEGEASHDG